MNISPIKTEEDYKAALSLVDTLSEAQVGPPVFDTLDSVVTLIEAYEAKHYPIEPPDPIAAIEYEMEKRGLSEQDLEAVIGSSDRVREVLSRRRPLTMPMIRRLHSAYGISLEVLMAEYSLSKPTRTQASNTRSASNAKTSRDRLARAVK